MTEELLEQQPQPRPHKQPQDNIWQPVQDGIPKQSPWVIVLPVTACSLGINFSSISTVIFFDSGPDPVDDILVHAHLAAQPIFVHHNHECKCCALSLVCSMSSALKALTICAHRNSCMLLCQYDEIVFQCGVGYLLQSTAAVSGLSYPRRSCCSKSNEQPNEQPMALACTTCFRIPLLPVLSEVSVATHRVVNQLVRALTGRIQLGTEGAKVIIGMLTFQQLLCRP